MRMKHLKLILVALILGLSFGIAGAATAQDGLPPPWRWSETDLSRMYASTPRVWSGEGRTGWVWFPETSSGRIAWPAGDSRRSQANWMELYGPWLALKGSIPMFGEMAVRFVEFSNDAADSRFREARRAFSSGRYDEAAKLFGRIRDRHRDSMYIPDSYYYEAFSLYQMGDGTSYRTALRLLGDQEGNYDRASTSGDAETLKMRIHGILAYRGEVEEWNEVAARARTPCDHDDLGQELRLIAASALHSMDPDRGLPIIRSILGDRDRCSANVRKQAVLSLQRNLTREAAGLVMDLAHRKADRDIAVRKAAVSILSRIRSKEAAIVRAALLRSSSDTVIQRMVVSSFGRSGEEEAPEALSAYVHRANAPENIQRSAIRFLGRIDKKDETRDHLKELYSKVKRPGLRERIISTYAPYGAEGNRVWFLEKIADASLSVQLRTKSLRWGGVHSGYDRKVKWPRSVGSRELLALYDKVPESELRRRVISGVGARAYPRRSRQSSADGVEAGDTILIAAIIQIAKTEKDLELRKQAVAALFRGNDDRTIAALVEIAKTEADADLRHRVIQQLTRKAYPRRSGSASSASVEGNPAAMRAVMEIAKTEKELPLRKTAVNALLGRDDDATTRTLIEITKVEKNGDLRKRVVQELMRRAYPRRSSRSEARKKGNARAIETLTRLVTSEQSLELRKQIVSAMYRGEDDLTMTTLVQVAKTEADTDLRHRVIQWLTRKAYPSRSSSASSGKVEGQPAAKSAVMEIAKTEKKLPLRKTAVNALLGRDDDATTQTLIEITKIEADGELRKRVMQELMGRAYPRRSSRSEARKKGNARAIETLTRLATSERNLELRKQVVSAMYRGEDDRTMTTLVQVAKTEADTDLRHRVIQQLTRKAYPSRSSSASSGKAEGNPAAMKAVMEIAKTEKRLTLRKTAVNALLGRDDDATTQTLIEITKIEKDDDLRRRVVRELTRRAYPRRSSRSEERKKGNARAIETVIRLATSEKNLELRKEIISAMYRGQDEKTTRALVQIAEKDANKELRTQVLRHLASRAYPSQGGRTRSGGEVEADPTARTALIKIAQSEPNAQLRKQAVDALLRASAGGVVTGVIVSRGGEGAQPLRTRAAGDRTFAALVQIAKSERDIELRTRVVRHLTGMAYPRRAGSRSADKSKANATAVAALVDIVKSESDKGIRRLVVQAMYRGSDDPTIEALIHVARKDPDVELRKEVLRHLTRSMSDDPRVASALLEAVRESKE